MSNKSFVFFDGLTARMKDQNDTIHSFMSGTQNAVVLQQLT